MSAELLRSPGFVAGQELITNLAKVAVAYQTVHLLHSEHASPTVVRAAMEDYDVKYRSVLPAWDRIITVTPFAENSDAIGAYSYAAANYSHTPKQEMGHRTFDGYTDMPVTGKISKFLLDGSLLLTQPKLGGKAFRDLYHIRPSDPRNNAQWATIEFPKSK